MKLTVIPRLQPMPGQMTCTYNSTNGRLSLSSATLKYIIENDFKSLRYAKDDDENLYMVFSSLGDKDRDANSYLITRRANHSHASVAASALFLSKGDKFLLNDVEGANEVKRLSLIPLTLKAPRVRFPAYTAKVEAVEAASISKPLKKAVDKKEEPPKPQLKMQEKKVHSQLGSSPAGNVTLQKRTVYDLVVDSCDIK